jgi:hypothetical protein
MTALEQMLVSSRLPLNAKLSNVRQGDYGFVIESIPEYLLRVLTYNRPIGVDITIVSPTGTISFQDCIAGFSTRTFTKYRFTGGIEDADFVQYSSDVTAHEAAYDHTHIAHGETAYGWGDHSLVGYVTGTPWTGAGYEVASNKVTSISSGSTDTQYGSAKLLYDQLQLKVNTVSGSSLVADTEIAKIHTQNTDTQIANGLHVVSLDSGGTLHVENISQVGVSYVTHAEQVYTTKDQIILRDGAVSGLAPGQYAGILAKLYDGTNDGNLVFDKDGYARVGDVGSLLKIATIEETPTNGKFTYYDSATLSLKTKVIATSDLPMGSTTGTVLEGRTFGTAAASATTDFDSSGAAASAVSGHESTYNHSNYNTAYGWGNWASNFGITTGKITQGDDSRLSDARTPVSHTHGNITNAGYLGTTISIPLITGTAGIIQAGSFGTTSGTFTQGNDSRLSDARTPTAHALINTTGHTVSGLTTGYFLKATGATTYAFGAHGLSYSNVGAAPASGSANYIQNGTSTQPANSTISGTAKANVLQSTVATGTSPLTVASTTLNTNLNADLLDGQHGSYYQPLLTNPITGTGTSGYIPKFTDASGLGNSPIYTDGTNVGIGTMDAWAKLQVVGSGGTAQSILIDNREIKFRGDAIAHYSIFANRVSEALTIDNTSNSAVPGVGGLVSNLATFLASGNVGIGYSSGTEIYNNKLAVNGSGYFNGLLQSSTAKFTTGAAANTIATGDSGGNLSWSTLASIGITSGTYTPATTNVTNITSSTPNNSTYTRVGNRVTVFGTVTITNTLAVASQVDIALPVASNLSAATDLNGTGTMDSTASVNLYINGDSTNDRARIFFTSAGVGQTSTIYFTFMYSVL